MLDTGPAGSASPLRRGLMMAERSVDASFPRGCPWTILHTSCHTERVEDGSSSAERISQAMPSKMIKDAEPSASSHMPGVRTSPVWWSTSARPTMRVPRLRPTRPGPARSPGSPLCPADLSLQLEEVPLADQGRRDGGPDLGFGPHGHPRAAGRGIDGLQISIVPSRTAIHRHECCGGDLRRRGYSNIDPARNQNDGG
jgi:hypothetical protein